ncbi:MAG TPA: hypothetical protein VKO18_02015 [Terriglobia bacterium]|nr:hypothetical protein [Terriglobia bacterium]
MKTKSLKFLLPMLYVAWAVCVAFYVFAIPARPNFDDADVVLIGLWTAFSLNLVGFLLALAANQIFWETHFWFYSDHFDRLGTLSFVLIIGGLLIVGILQWYWTGLLVTRGYHALRQRFRAVKAGGECRAR